MTDKLAGPAPFPPSRPPLDARRVALLRHAIKSGAFYVNPDAIAQALLRLEAELYAPAPDRPLAQT